MIFPTRFVKPLQPSSGKSTGSPLTPLTSRLSVIITFLVGLLLLVDHQLETLFIASPIIEIDKASKRITTEAASFLPKFHDVAGPEMREGELLILEVSPLTKTVVAFKPPDALLVRQPRELIFDYWPITSAFTILSLFLIIRWNHLQRHFELLMINLILLVVISILYFVSH